MVLSKFDDFFFPFHHCTFFLNFHTQNTDTTTTTTSKLSRKRDPPMTVKELKEFLEAEFTSKKEVKQSIEEKDSIEEMITGQFGLQGTLMALFIIMERWISTYLTCFYK